MSNLYWHTPEKMERLRPHIPMRPDRPGVDERPALWELYGDNWICVRDTAKPNQGMVTVNLSVTMLMEDRYIERLLVPKALGLRAPERRYHGLDAHSAARSSLRWCR